VVITSVTRDDLEDGGSGHFVETINEIRKINKNCQVEVLIPDFKGNWLALEKIIKAKPEVVNHNLETTKENFEKVRPVGDYKTSLELLKKIKKIDSKIIAKSGFMVGLGETKKQIIELIKDLKKVDCDILTVGQYLQPGSQNFKVKKYYKNNEFDWIIKIARKNGIKNVIAGTLIRSSYKANELFKKV
jgi:lipoic acid synthetase